MPLSLSQKDHIELLRRSPLFDGVSGRILELLVEIAAPVQVARGQRFFIEGDAADCMYVLESGAAAVLKRWEGRQYLLHGLGAGECFGEMALVDPAPRSASVVALEDCTAVRLFPWVLARVYAEDQQQYLTIQQNMSRLLCRRLRETNDALFKPKTEVILTDGELSFRRSS